MFKIWLALTTGRMSRESGKNVAHIIVWGIINVMMWAMIHMWRL